MRAKQDTGCQKLKIKMHGNCDPHTMRKWVQLFNMVLSSRGARVLLALGDNLGNQKADPQLLNRTLSAAVSRDAKQFILVTPLGGIGGGGFFAGLFGGGGASSKQPSKTERQVRLCNETNSIKRSRRCTQAFLGSMILLMHQAVMG